MGENSKIEWTDHTFNPWIGCTKVSEGCKFCYAERDNWHYKWNPAGWGPQAARKCTSEDNWKKPLQWDRAAAKAGVRKRVFCASLADVFDDHPSIDRSWRGDLYLLMMDTSHIDWLLLTKRPENIFELAPQTWTRYQEWPKNVWIGTTAENQEQADKRILELLKVPARVRFLSCEPLLGALDIWRWLLPLSAVNKLNWVIAGGESGAHARPMHPDWVRGLRDQCQVAGVSFFFKQWGEWLPVAAQYGDDDLIDKLDPEAHSICLGNRGTIYSEERGLKQEYWCGYQPEPGQNPWYLERVGKKAAGRELDGRTWDEFPKVLQEG